MVARNLEIEYSPNEARVSCDSPIGGRNTKWLPITKEQVTAWLAGGHIQTVMPHLTDDDREFLISGCTKEDFDTLFPSTPKETTPYSPSLDAPLTEVPSSTQVRLDTTNYETMCKHAREESFIHDCVQHVNRGELDGQEYFTVSDWEDGSTLASYEQGRQLRNDREGVAKLRKVRAEFKAVFVYDAFVQTALEMAGKPRTDEEQRIATKAAHAFLLYVDDDKLNDGFDELTKDPAWKALEEVFGDTLYDPQS